MAAYSLPTVACELADPQVEQLEGDEYGDPFGECSSIAAGPPAVYCTDGSGGKHTRDRLLRRCGWAAVRVGLDSSGGTVVAGGIFGPLPGLERGRGWAGPAVAPSRGAWCRRRSQRGG